MGTKPEELIEELRGLARASSLDVAPDLDLSDTIEWDAADFIQAARPILQEAARGTGWVAEAARELLAGEYPAAADE
ncbi:MAG: hypothetical protein JWQ97_3729 [Phenylobacterium sp.]|nr:hypothetical protein [Phenylobacterium sp.]